jgi:hypothetical protein
MIHQFFRMTVAEPGLSRLQALGWDTTKVARYESHRCATDNIIANQKLIYEKIFLKKDNFHTPAYHYDWFQFPITLPINMTPSPSAVYYSINDTERRILLASEEFRMHYKNSIEKYLSAQLNEWNGYPIRFIKIIFSLSGFIQETALLPEYHEFHTDLKNLATLALSLNRKHNIEHDPKFNQMGGNEYNAINRLQSVLGLDQQALLEQSRACKFM